MNRKNVTPEEFELFRHQVEEERRELQLEINVLRRSIAQLRLKLLGEEQHQIRRIS